MWARKLLCTHPFIFRLTALQIFCPYLIEIFERSNAALMKLEQVFLVSLTPYLTHLDPQLTHIFL